MLSPLILYQKFIKIEFLINHFPYIIESKDNYINKYKKYRPIDNKKWLLHGHVHEKWKINNKMINVGIDVLNFEPVALEELIKIKFRKIKCYF